MSDLLQLNQHRHTAANDRGVVAADSQQKISWSVTVCGVTMTSSWFVGDDERAEKKRREIETALGIKTEILK